MVFVDASALIAIIAGEPDAAELADLLEADRLRLCSAVSTWETVAGLCRLDLGDGRRPLPQLHLFSPGSANPCPTFP
jgi:uncharacterized protein with PIN domain